VSLALDVVEGIPAFPTDFFLLEQVLGNLLSNALKFTAAGGRVRVAAAPVRGAVLPGKMLLLAGGFGLRPRFVQIVIEDSGIGLSPETRRHLFQPFYRGQEAAQHAGSGLGLTVARRLVGMLHGDLRADDCRSGARFVLTLPADAATRALAGNIDTLYAALRRQLAEHACSLLVARLQEDAHAPAVAAAIETLAQQTDSQFWQIAPTTWVVLGNAPVRQLYRELATLVSPGAIGLRDALHVQVRRARRGETVDELALQTVVRCRRPLPPTGCDRPQHGSHKHSGTEVA
jgi:hypothetical protein